MSVFQVDNVDEQSLHALISTINKHHEVSEVALLQLDRNPGDAALLNSLYAAVNGLRQGLSTAGFAPLMPLMNAVVSMLDQLRQGVISFSPMISDLVLLILDKVRGFVEIYRLNAAVEYDQVLLADLEASVIRIAVSDPADYQQQIADAICLLDPIVSESLYTDTGVPGDSFLAGLGLAAEPELQFFRDLMEPVERRSKYWQGRGDRILKMALLINQQGGCPVDELQLAAAAYTHDFGMAFMPLELLHKASTLSDSEIVLLRSHVQSSAHLLQHMPKWAPAREIVLQHHETADGSGYPYGLREKEMCTGAKILAVADTFDAITHQRAYASHQKRPILRAIKEINDCAGRQLSRVWVKAFNQVVEPILVAHRINKL